LKKFVKKNKINEPNFFGGKKIITKKKNLHGKKNRSKQSLWLWLKVEAQSIKISKQIVIGIKIEPPTMAKGGGSVKWDERLLLAEVISVGQSVEITNWLSITIGWQQPTDYRL
jgi:hypothetical protein